jgi:hypothetical protein
MSTVAEQTKRQTNDQSGDKKKPFRPFKKPEEKPGGLPMLKYGKGNNYFKFKQALAEMAIKEYGNLGKLIELEKYYIPKLELPDYAAMGVDSSQVKVMQKEATKGLAKEIDKMRADRPRLYGLIRQHMSVESRDEVAQQPDYADWHAEKDPEKLWQAIVKTHKVDSASHVTEVMELTARKAYQGIRMGTFKTLAMYSERFHETYRAYKATASAANPVDVKDEVQAMDFFLGLDNQRYAAFKTSMMNGWATTAVKAPKTPNEVYRLAGSWIKQPTRMESGYAATFVTNEEDARRTNKKRNPGKGKPKPQGGGGNTDDSGSSNGEKEKKDLSHIQCFKCKEYGHYSTSKSCPMNKKNQDAESSQDRATFANATWQTEQEAGMFMTQEVMEEHVVNNVMQAQGLLPTEILLDNTVNISIMNPRLLKSVRPAGKRIRVKGVGGVQMVVEHVGDLEGFFEVCASDEVRANILSFAAVEDMYEVTYSRGEGFTVHIPERDIVFRRRDNLYIVDWAEVGSVHATVQENESLYSAKQVRRAKLAHEFVRNCGYPSPAEAVHIVQDGNV